MRLLKRLATIIPLVMLITAHGPSLSAQHEGSEIKWMTLNEGLEAVRGSGKKLLIDFYTDWCGWCKRMDRDTYADSGVASFISQNFVAVRFNPEKSEDVKYDGGEYPARQFASAMGVRSYPSTGFITDSIEVITLLPGYLKAGEFLNVLKFISADLYLTMSFDQYLASQSTDQGSE